MGKIKFQEEKKAMNALKKLYKIHNYSVTQKSYVHKTEGGHVWFIRLGKKKTDRLEGLEKFSHLSLLDLCYFNKTLPNLDYLITLDLKQLHLHLTPEQIEANTDMIIKIHNQKPTIKFTKMFGVNVRYKKDGSAKITTVYY